MLFDNNQRVYFFNDNVKNITRFYDMLQNTDLVLENFRKTSAK
jgi:hypothetical protein